MAWLDLDPAGARPGRANMVAVGGMEPGIEIWDLDLADQVEPTATLGGYEAGASGGPAGAEGLSREEKRKARKKAAAKKKKAAAAAPALKAGSHEGAVLALSWNAGFRNVLASGGADCTVKVWDLAAQRCEHTLRHHKGKVQAVAWNPAEPPVLLSAGFDRAAALADARAPAAPAAAWALPADAEAAAWAPHAPTCFVVSTEDGLVTCFDARGGAGAFLYCCCLCVRCWLFSCMRLCCACCVRLVFSAATVSVCFVCAQLFSTVSQLTAHENKSGAKLSRRFLFWGRKPPRQADARRRLINGLCLSASCGSLCGPWG